MDNQSLSHSRYNCTYHIVFIPKYRRKVMFGQLRKEVGEAISKVCKMEGGNDHKGSNAARPCAYVCVDPTKGMCSESSWADQREEQPDAL